LRHERVSARRRPHRALALRPRAARAPPRGSAVLGPRRLHERRRRARGRRPDCVSRADGRDRDVRPSPVGERWRRRSQCARDRPSGRDHRVRGAGDDGEPVQLFEGHHDLLDHGGGPRQLRLPRRRQGTVLMFSGYRSAIEKTLLRMFPRVMPPAFTMPIYFERRRTPRNRMVRLLYSAVAWNYDLVVVERVVEIPFVLQHVPPGSNTKVLDFGCTESPLPIHLASRGYPVTGVDLRTYPYAHPGFRFVHGDFIRVRFPDAEFDAVVAVSAIEHCGLGQYGEKESVHDDVAIVREIRRVLKRG